MSYYHNRTRQASLSYSSYIPLLLFQSGQLSRGAACEFADVDIYTFLAACKQHRIETISTDMDEIEAEVIRFKQLRAA